jgi:hypothetical protein
MPKLIVTIVNAGTPEVDVQTGLPVDHITGERITPSIAGHMWYTIRNDDGTEVHNYGFAPKAEFEGRPFAIGEPHKNDQSRYQIDLETGDRQYTNDITQEQFRQLYDFGENPSQYGFKLERYNIISNSCVDFVWKALFIAGFETHGFEGHPLPIWNANNIENLLSISGDHIFTRISPQDLNITASQYLELMADNFKIHPVDLFNLDQKFFSQIFTDHNSNNATYTAYRGNQSAILDDQDLIAHNHHGYLDRDHNLIDPASLILNVNIANNNQQLSLVRNDASIIFDDKTSASLNNIVQMGLQRNIAIANFITNHPSLDNHLGHNIGGNFIAPDAMDNQTNLHSIYTSNDSFNFDYHPIAVIAEPHIANNFVSPHYFDQQTTLNSNYSNNNHFDNSSFNSNNYYHEPVSGGHVANNFVPPNYFDSSTNLNSSYFDKSATEDFNDQENVDSQCLDNDCLNDQSISDYSNWQLQHVELNSGNHILG